MELSDEQEATSTVRLSTLEKGVATVLSTLVILLLGWVGYTTNETAKAISVVQTRLDYIGGDAKKALELREGTETKLQDHEARLLRLEMLEGLSMPRSPKLREDRDEAGR